jgi:hypothetical protein
LIVPGARNPCAMNLKFLSFLPHAHWVAPKEVTSCPTRRRGAERASSNDVTIDDRRRIYLVDRVAGLDIIETNVLARGLHR